MFYNCKKLKGENGTKYNSSKMDKEYARIDREDEPGYLTASTHLFAVVKGASLSLDGNIGINFYLDTWGNDVVGAYMYDMEGSESIESYLTPESQKVTEGAYKGYYKFSYGVNSTQTDRKIFLEAMGYTRHADGTLADDTPIDFLLYDTEGNRLDKDRFGFSVQDYQRLIKI